MNHVFKLAIIIAAVLYGAAALQWWLRARREKRARHEDRNSTVLHQLGMLKPGQSAEDARREAGERD